MKELLKKLEKEPSFLNYLDVYNKLKNVEMKGKEIRIALLSSFTIEPLKYFLDIECKKLNLNPKIYIAPYNQYNQEILNLDSGLYNFNPEITILILDSETLFPELDSFEKENFDDFLNNLNNLIETFDKNSNSILLVSNFIIPYYSPLGILDDKVEFGIKKKIIDLNLKIRDLLKKKNNVYLFDLEKLAAYHGKKNIKDHKIDLMGKIKISKNFFLPIAKEIISYIKPLKGLSKKCIVLDCDNTLWGGIIGEDGLNGIKLDDNYPGNAFVAFQKTLLNLNKKGVLLALNSKNNYDDVIEVFEKHPNMILKLENFACIKITWLDKVTNMKEIADELNIGLDSLVFIDDSPVERSLMRQLLPEVLTLEIPKEPALYSSALEELNDFEILSFTEEDRKKTQMYREEKKRKKLKENSKSLEDFYYSLQTKVEIKEGDEFTIPRITQLVNKTNQFNLTTKRYNETQIRNFCNSDKYKVYYIKVIDKFGDNGITGVAIIEKKDREWFIDSLLLSCRILGRTIEFFFLNKIIKDAKNKDVDYIYGNYIPTKKNIIVKDFFPNNKFELIKNENESSYYKLNVKNYKLDFPKWIEIE